MAHCYNKQQSGLQLNIKSNQGIILVLVKLLRFNIDWEVIGLVLVLRHSIDNRTIQLRYKTSQAHPLSYLTSFKCPSWHCGTPVQTSSWQHLHGVNHISPTVLRCLNRLCLFRGICCWGFLVLYAWSFWAPLSWAPPSPGSALWLDFYPNEIVTCLSDKLIANKHYVGITWAIDVTRCQPYTGWKFGNSGVEVTVANRRTLAVLNWHQELCWAVFWTHLKNQSHAWLRYVDLVEHSIIGSNVMSSGTIC